MYEQPSQIHAGRCRPTEHPTRRIGSHVNHNTPETPKRLPAFTYGGIRNAKKSPGILGLFYICLYSSVPCIQATDE